MGRPRSGNASRRGVYSSKRRRAGRRGVPVPLHNLFRGTRKDRADGVKRAKMEAQRTLFGSRCVYCPTHRDVTVQAQRIVEEAQKEHGEHKTTSTVVLIQTCPGGQFLLDFVEYVRRRGLSLILFVYSGSFNCRTEEVDHANQPEISLGGSLNLLGSNPLYRKWLRLVDVSGIGFLGARLWNAGLNDMGRPFPRKALQTYRPERYRTLSQLITRFNLYNIQPEKLFGGSVFGAAFPHVQALRPLYRRLCRNHALLPQYRREVLAAQESFMHTHQVSVDLPNNVVRGSHAWARLVQERMARAHQPFGNVKHFKMLILEDLQRAAPTADMVVAMVLAITFQVPVVRHVPGTLQVHEYGAWRYQRFASFAPDTNSRGIRLQLQADRLEDVTFLLQALLSCLLLA